jgi:hypothetical protein
MLIWHGLTLWLNALSLCWQFPNSVHSLLPNHTIFLFRSGQGNIGMLSKLRNVAGSHFDTTSKGSCQIWMALPQGIENWSAVQINSWVITVQLCTFYCCKEASLLCIRQMYVHSYIGPSHELNHDDLTEWSGWHPIIPLWIYLKLCELCYSLPKTLLSPWRKSAPQIHPGVPEFYDASLSMDEL